MCKAPHLPGPAAFFLTVCGCACLPAPAPDQVLVERGSCPLLQKAQHVHESGGAAVVIADVAGTCDETFSQLCLRGSSKAHDEGFAYEDDAQLWRPLDLPALLITAAGTRTLRDLTNTT